MIEVSVIIPCYNEEKYIGQCLDSIIRQDYSKENLEILVVDGRSQDKTREIVKNFQFSNPNFQIKLLDNPKKFTPVGLNIGVKNARGEIIIRMDAHAGYEDGYILKCVRYLKEYNVDNVGGAMKTVPKENTPMARAIAICLSNQFGAGDSFFRIGSKKPRLVDTIFGGCYKKSVFAKIGYFNENLIRSQDIEFNKRLVKSGGKILLVPDIISYYYPKSNLLDFWQHNFEDGFWTTYPLKFGIRIFSFRHLIPLFFVKAIILFLIFSPFFWLARFFFNLIFLPYLLLIFFFSLRISVKIGLKCFPSLVLAFLCRHFAYGLGSIQGLIKALIL